MSLIDSSYFVGPLTVAQLGQSYVENDLNTIIGYNETDFLSAVLGYELYEAMTTGLEATSPDQKWLDLRDGCKFITTTNFPGYFPVWIYSYRWFLNSIRKTFWVGFAPTDKIYQSPLVGYCFYRYMENLRTQATGVGVVKAQAGAAIGGVDQGKLIKAWNQMSKDIFTLWLFLAAKGTDVYPEYDVTKIDFSRFRPQNLLGI